MSKTINNIIYAEDEEDIRVIAQVALEDIGKFNVKFCQNGKEVIELAKTFTPDLVLLDVMMPFMDGPTALSELRKMPSMQNVPAIFMTAKIQSDEVNKYKEMGAIEVITKPFDPMTLANLIKQIWIHHQEAHHG